MLNRLGYATGKGKRWNQIRGATARRNHSIAGHKRASADPENVSLNEAARLCGVSHRSIERLVEAGLRENKRPRVLHGKFVARIWTQSPFEASSRSSAAQASLFSEGDVWEISLSCSFRINQMIMTGIVSEGSETGSTPRCGARRRNRSPRPDVWDSRR